MRNSIHNWGPISKILKLITIYNMQITMTYLGLDLVRYISMSRNTSELLTESEI